MTFDSFETRGLARRRLRYAFVASLLLHLSILWPAALRILTKDTPSLLQATLRAPRQAPAELAPAKPPARAVARPRSGLPGTQSEPLLTLAPPVPKPESPLLEQPAPSSVPRKPVVPAEPVAKPASGPESLAVAAAALPAPAAAGLASGFLLTEANAPGESVDGMRGYRLALAAQARHFKRYPAQAMASGWTGTADIRVEVASDGRPRAATVLRSSGHEPLDRAALAMIDAGALRARLPESLRGKAFAVVLPVVFNLEDE